jgi:hypothetical protein
MDVKIMLDEGTCSIFIISIPWGSIYAALHQIHISLADKNPLRFLMRYLKQLKVNFHKWVSSILIGRVIFFEYTLALPDPPQFLIFNVNKTSHNSGVFYLVN